MRYLLKSIPVKFILRTMSHVLESRRLYLMGLKALNRSRALPSPTTEEFSYIYYNDTLQVIRDWEDDITISFKNTGDAHPRDVLDGSYILTSRFVDRRFCREFIKLITYPTVRDEEIREISGYGLDFFKVNKFHYKAKQSTGTLALGDDQGESYLPMQPGDFEKVGWYLQSFTLGLGNVLSDPKIRIFNWWH